MLLPLVFFSCEKEVPKEGPTTVKGQVLDKTTNTPLSGAVVQIDMRNKTDGSTSFKASTATTDKNGNFTIDFHAAATEQYSMRAAVPGRYPLEWSEICYINNGARNENMRLRLQPLTWAEVRLVNEAPRKPVSMVISGLSEQPLHLFLTANDTSFYTGMNGSITKKTVSWTITETDRSSHLHTQDFYMPPLDTTQIRITF